MHSVVGFVGLRKAVFQVEEKKRNWERSRNSQAKTGAWAVSFDRRPLQCYQIEASEWSEARACAHTHTHCLSFPLLSLVCFPSRDELLADRTGPLGSCYRPPQRTDWKALIAALRSPQSRENHSLSVTESFTWDTGKRVNEGEKRENEGQVRHPVRVREGKKKQRKEREWQKLTNTQTISKEDKSERNHEGLCLAVFTLFTRKDSSRYWRWHMSGF